MSFLTFHKYNIQIIDLKLIQSSRFRRLNSLIFVKGNYKNFKFYQDHQRKFQYGENFRIP